MSGKVLPCCKFTGETPNIYNVDNLDSIAKSNEYQSIQKTLESGKWPSGCWMCKNDETAGIQSRREYSNSIHKKQNHLLPIDIEVSLDYTCNLMCRMCGPDASSKWGSAKTVIQQFNDLGINLNQNTSGKSYKEYQDKFIEVWENSDLSQLKVIRLIGGEPFYAKHIDRFFEKLYTSKKSLRSVKMYINTNATIFPSDKTVEYLTQLGRCKIDFSVDAEGELAECLRYGKSWRTIEDTILKWVDLRNKHKNIVLGSCITINILNFNLISRLIDFLNKHNIDVWFNHLLRPKYLSVYQLTKDERMSLMDKLDEPYNTDFKNLVLADEFIEPEFDSLYKSIDILDSYQGVSFKQANPQIYKMIKERAND